MRTFLSNMLSLMAGNVYTLAISFVFSLLLVQRLSVEEYGLQSTLVAFTTIVMSVAYLGLFNVTTRQLTGRSPEEQTRIYNSVLSLVLLLSTAACLLASLIALVLNSFPGAQYTILRLSLFTLVL